MDRGDPTWQTRSTAPMSIPNSREDVATHSLTRPSLSRCSASWRVFWDRLPWWATTDSSPQSLRHLVGEALYETACVHEQQRGVVALGKLRYAVQNQVPLVVGGDGPKLVLGQLKCQVHGPGVAGIHDEAVGGAVGGYRPAPHQEPGHLIDGTLGGRQPDACHGALGQGAESLDREAEVGAPLVVRDGVELVQDQSTNTTQVAAAALGGQQDVEGLGRSDEDVGRPLDHGLALAGRRISGADGYPDLGQGCAHALGEGVDLGQGSARLR